jgi:AcrR family transcriptional regulator
MRETGLEKEGIYNHFSSKEQLALEAFDCAYRLVQQRVREALAGRLNSIERLLALVTVFQGIIEDSRLSAAARFSLQHLRRMMLTR